jgi:hypothetical protein
MLWHLECSARPPSRWAATNITRTMPTPISSADSAEPDFQKIFLNRAARSAVARFEP